ncbi:hypothetical protein NGRA_0458 [Nosema granulosis]|uniref:Uncharacterized protein n=1 Tax=Nosema granulosis TaxID=83296 RepID=A0A9P6H3J8_9MICR|nr:hypothetical protein NGRA_0458 [Nosema granulosis]
MINHIYLLLLFGKILANKDKAIPLGQELEIIYDQDVNLITYHNEEERKINVEKINKDKDDAPIEHSKSLVKPKSYKSKYSKNINEANGDLIQEYGASEDKILFYIVFEKDRSNNKYYISQIKKGKYIKGQEAEDMIANYTNLLIEDYNRKVFVVGDNIENKVKLDKSIEYYELMCLDKMISSMLNTIIFYHINILDDILGSQNKDKEKYYDEINDLFISKYINSKLCSIEISNQYNSNKYEQFLLNSKDRCLKYEILNIINSLLVKDNEDFIEKLEDISNELSKEQDFELSYSWKDCIDLVNDIAQRFVSFKKASKNKRAKDENYIEKRNVQYRRQIKPKHSNGDKRTQRLMKYYKMLHNYMLLNLEKRKVELHLFYDSTVQKYQSESSKKYETFLEILREINFESKENINEYKKYSKMKLDLEIFRKYPLNQNLRVLLKEEGLKSIKVYQIVSELEDVQNFFKSFIKNQSEKKHKNSETLRSIEESLKLCSTSLEKWSEIESQNLSISDLLSEEEIKIPEDNKSVKSVKTLNSDKLGNNDNPDNSLTCNIPTSDNKNTMILVFIGTLMVFFAGLAVFACFKIYT